MHHLPPHRRISYLRMLDRLLAPRGHLGLVSFASGAMGCEAADEQLYLQGGLEGGLAFTPDAPRWISRHYSDVELRPMRAQSLDTSLFGEPFLLTALFRRTDR